MTSSRARRMRRMRLTLWRVPVRAGWPVLTVAMFVARLGHAVPIDDPEVGGIGFSGPTTGDVAAIYWNPAALALINGPELTLSGTARLTTTTATLADPTTGAGFPQARARDFQHPFLWPPGPGTFAGLAYDVGGDRFTLGVALYMPFAERTSYDLPAASSAVSAALSPVHDHRITADLRDLALVPALAVRLAGELRLGVAPGLLFSTGRLSFDEPAAGEQPGGQPTPGDTRYALDSGQGFGPSRFAVTLGLGLYYRRRDWELGVSFASRPFGGDVAGASVVGASDVGITHPFGPTATAPVVTCAGHPDGSGCVYAEMISKRPYTITVGGGWHPKPGVELTAMARLLSFPADDVIDIRLTGVNLASFGVPEHIVLYRGYGTVLDTRVRAARWMTKRLRLGVGLRFETGALPSAAVSPASVDGDKLEPTAMVLFSPLKHLFIGGGYGLTYLFPVTASGSVFDPGFATRCAASGHDLGSPDCAATNQGRARPSADGTYRRLTQAFSLSVTTQF